MKPPSERRLAEVERELRKLPRGSQRAVGGGVYMRLDKDGRRRFQIRVRAAGAQTGSTFDSWQEAHDEQQRLNAPRPAPPAPSPTPAPLPSFDMSPGAGNVIGPTAEQMRQMTFRDYRKYVYWPWAKVNLDPLTLVDYRRKLRNDVEPIIGDYTLAQLVESPLLVDHFKDELAKCKRYPKTRTRKGKTESHPKAGQLEKAAADGAIRVASSVMKHALEKHVVSRNPFQGIPRFNRRKTARGTSNASYRRVKQSEVLHPRVVAQVASGLRGTWQVVEQCRLALDLIAHGWRPSDTIGSRHYDLRDQNGPRERAHVREAVKDLAGHLALGEPKTGERDLELFSALGWQAERVYQAQQCPPLEEIVIPNNRGGLLDWGNFRDDRWYPALQRAGFISAASAEAIGAFDPYLLRHIGVSTMLHAQRSEGGTYSVLEVARQFGHTPETLLRVYADIPDDMHGIAGMTMDEIIWAVRREIYGPMPVDPDFDDRLYTIKEAAELIGMDAKKLGGRVNRRTIPATLEGGRYLISEFDLVWLGWLHPSSRRRI